MNKIKAYGILAVLAISIFKGVNEETEEVKVNAPEPVATAPAINWVTSKAAALEQSSLYKETEVPVEEQVEVPVQEDTIETESTDLYEYVDDTDENEVITFDGSTVQTDNQMFDMPSAEDWTVSSAVTVVANIPETVFIPKTGYEEEYYEVNTNEYVEEPTDTISTEETSGIVVEPDGNEENVIWFTDRVQTMLGYVPYNLQQSFFEKGCKINVVPSSFVESQGYIAYLETYNGGEYYEIYISNRDDCIEQSVVHEFGHYLDRICGRPSQNDEFQQLMLSEGANIGLSSYYTTNPSEYFAEMFQEMMLHPDGDRVNSCPQTVAYIRMYIDFVEGGM